MIDIAGRPALVLAPHADDAEFGCGGTVAKLVGLGADIHVVVFSPATRHLDPPPPRERLVGQVHAAAAALGVDEGRVTVHDFAVRDLPRRRQDVLEILVSLNRDVVPALVLMPSLGDLHQDHETLAREGMRAFKRTTLLGYDMARGGLGFRQQAYVDLEPAHVDAKVAAIACYSEQGHRPYGDETYVRTLARTRGIESGRDLAEVFEVYRLIL